MLLVFKILFVDTFLISSSLRLVAREISFLVKYWYF